jgi:hypothetical protein
MYTFMASFIPTRDTSSPYVGLSNVVGSTSYYSAISPVAGNLCIVNFHTLIKPTQQTVEYSLFVPFGGNFQTSDQANIISNNLYYPTDKTILAGDCFRGCSSNAPRNSIDIQLFIDAALVAASSGGGGGSLAHNFSVIYKIC